MTRTLTIHHTYFLEDDVYEGELGDTTVVTEVSENLTARETADIIIREGLTFAATGGAWAANPDGSRITNYATAERCETTAHLDGYPERVEAAIMSAVS